MLEDMAHTRKHTSPCLERQQQPDFPGTRGLYRDWYAYQPLSLIPLLTDLCSVASYSVLRASPLYYNQRQRRR